jgi:hypothetical protein
MISSTMRGTVLESLNVALNNIAPDCHLTGPGIAIERKREAVDEIRQDQLVTLPSVLEC